MTTKAAPRVAQNRILFAPKGLAARYNRVISHSVAFSGVASSQHKARLAATMPKAKDAKTSTQVSLAALTYKQRPGPEQVALHVEIDMPGSWFCMGHVVSS